MRPHLRRDKQQVNGLNSPWSILDAEAVGSSDRPAGRPWARPARWAGNLAVFLAGFALIARLLAPAQSTDRLLRAKLEHFRQHKEEYDLVFFGSSRIYRAFDPKVFCRELADRGRPLRAMNFGVGAMRPHEVSAVIRRVQATRPARLRWVMVELMHWEPTILDGMSRHPRTIDWHEPRETWSACRTEWLADLPTVERLSRCGTHVARMAQKYTNFGQGPRRVREWLGEDRLQRATRDVVAAGDGFVAVDDQPGPYYDSRRRTFLTKYYDVFLRQIEAIPAGQRRPATLENFDVAATERQQAAIRAAGAEPIYVVPNVRWGTPVLHRLGEEGVIANFIALNDPQSLPELYEPDHYFDRGHLNRRGAEIFSAELARRFADWLEQR